MRRQLANSAVSAPNGISGLNVSAIALFLDQSATLDKMKKTGIKDEKSYTPHFFIIYAGNALNLKAYKKYTGNSI